METTTSPPQSPEKDPTEASSEGKTEVPSSPTPKETSLEPEPPVSPKPEEEEKQLGPATLLPAASNAYLLLQDICLACVGEPTIWIKIEGFVAPFGLELIENALTNFSGIFLEVILQFQKNTTKTPEFGVLLKDRVVPLLFKTYKTSDFVYTLRSVRISVAFVKNFGDLMVTKNNLSK